MHTDALKPIGTKVAQSRTKPYKALCGPAVNFQSLTAVRSVSYINCTRSCILRTTVAPHLSLYFQCIAAAEHPLGLGFSPILCYSYLTRAALGFRSLLPPYHHEPLCSRSPLTSKFLVRILGESHPVSFRAEDKATAHNRVVLGSENPHFEDSRDQSLGDALRTGVLGKPAIALCAVPLLIPVSALICAQERP